MPSFFGLLRRAALSPLLWQTECMKTVADAPLLHPTVVTSSIRICPDAYAGAALLPSTVATVLEYSEGGGLVDTWCEIDLVKSSQIFSLYPNVKMNLSGTETPFRHPSFCFHWKKRFLLGEGSTRWVWEGGRVLNAHVCCALRVCCPTEGKIMRWFTLSSPMQPSRRRRRGWVNETHSRQRMCCPTEGNLMNFLFTLSGFRVIFCFCKNK